MITHEQSVAIYKISLLVYKERKNNNTLPLIDKPSFKNMETKKRSKNK